MIETSPKCVIIPELEDESDDSTPVDSEEEDEAARWMESPEGPDIPQEYWHIQKLIKYMKAGDQTATIVALCCLKDHDLTTEINQIAIRDIGGLEVLVNLLETEDLKCKLGSLSVLSEISENADVRKGITNLGAIPLLVTTLSEQGRNLQMLAAGTLANLSKIQKARRAVRRFGGIPKLVHLLDVDDYVLITPKEELSPEEKEEAQVAAASAKALWSLSVSKRNRFIMRKAGCVRLLARLLKSVHGEVVIPIMGTIQQCATEKEYQLAIQTEGMIPDLVRQLTADKTELKKHAASALFKCAIDPATRNLVRESGGLDPLVVLAKDKNLGKDKALLGAVTGAIWKCAITPENVARLEELRTVAVLVGLLDDENEEVLTNVSGGLAECCKTENNRNALRLSHGIPKIVQLLNGSHGPMLENVCRTLGFCANEPECMEIIEELDGVRLIWSQLKHPSTRVQAEAAWALCPCIRNASDSGEMVRSFVGGLELIVSLLKSTDTQVLACVCAALAQIAQDSENLAVITDHGVVSKLAELVHTIDSRMPVKRGSMTSENGRRKSSSSSVNKGAEDGENEQGDNNAIQQEVTCTREDQLRQHLSEAIAYCCSWGSNCHEFGRLGAISPLVSYMGSKNKDVHRTTAFALYQLSMDPFNCITMHQCGVVSYLLETIGSADEKLQEASAGCLSNIRRLALNAEKVRYNL